MKYPLLFCGALFATSQPLALADDVFSTLNQQTIITLTTQAENYIENDTIQITFYKEGTATSYKQLNQELEKTSLFFNDIIKNHDPSIIVNTQSINSHPTLNRNGKLKDWQGRISFSLQGNDLVILAPYLEQLSEHFSIEQLTYSISKDKFDRSIDELLPKALKRLQQQATIMAENLGKKIINIEKVDINYKHLSTADNYSLSKSNTNKSDYLFSSYSADYSQKGKSLIVVSLKGEVTLE